MGMVNLFRDLSIMILLSPNQKDLCTKSAHPLRIAMVSNLSLIRRRILAHKLISLKLGLRSMMDTDLLLKRL